MKSSIKVNNAEVSFYVLARTNTNGEAEFYTESYINENNIVETHETSLYIRFARHFCNYASASDFIVDNNIIGFAIVVLDFKFIDCEVVDSSVL